MDIAALRPAPLLRGLVYAVVLALRCVNAEAQDRCPKATETEARRLQTDIEDLRQRGRWQEAVAPARCLVDLAGILFGPEHPTTRNLVVDLALILRAGGRTKEAMELEKRYASMVPPEAGRADIADIQLLVVESKSLLDRGDRDGAGQACVAARRLVDLRHLTQHPIFSAVLNECGRTYEAHGNVAMAEQRYIESAKVARDYGGARDPNLSVALNNLGSLYWHLGRYREAQDVLEEVVKRDGKENPEGIPTVINLGLVYEATGRDEDARKLYLSARDLTIQTYGESHPSLIYIFDNLAARAWRRGELVEAVDWQVQANAVAERNVRSVIGLGSERQKLAYIRSLQAATHASISLSLAGSRPSQRALDTAFEAVIRRKGAVLDAMSDSMARLRKNIRPEEIALLDRLAAVANRLSTMTYGGPRDLSRDAYRSQLKELSRQQDVLEIELAKRSARFRSEIEPLTLSRVRSAIPKDAVLLEWFRYEPYRPLAKETSAKWGAPRYVVYVLASRDEVAAVDLGDAESIDALVREFRGALSDRTSMDSKALAEKLSLTLVKPLRPYINKASRLLISPDGALNLLPFAALLDEKGEYLITRFDISYLTSGSDLVRFSSESRSTGAAVIVANPDFGKRTPAVSEADVRAAGMDGERAGLAFAPLPGTAAEAKTVRDLLKIDERNVLTQASATEANVKQLRAPRILHVATHAFFLKDRPPAASALASGTFDQPGFFENPLLRSGLALAGANARHSGSSDDGILTAFEAAQLDLSGTELVVLSACETGVGQVENGEGVYGLRRALVLAGAETQLASLWKVPDAATRDLMVAYYGRLLNGEGRSAALRGVQKAMLASRELSHPYYWAAFVPIGNWASMRSLRSR